MSGDAADEVVRIMLNGTEVAVRLAGSGIKNLAALLISLEGFTDSVENPPAIRVIDLEAGKQVEVAFCRDMGTNVEPEFVDYQGDVCWYSDNHGNLYNLTF